MNTTEISDNPSNNYFQFNPDSLTERHVGVTGTRRGMTPYQYEVVERYLSSLVELFPTSRYALHHGDCVGVDFEVAELARDRAIRTVSHPPINTILRAYHPSDVILPAAGYLERDRAIVHASVVLIVVPKEMNRPENTRSGTWYTYNFAISKHVPIFIAWPERTNWCGRQSSER